jgi:hypothetical protein
LSKIVSIKQKSRPKIFGLGTILALILAVVIIGSGWFTGGGQTGPRSGNTAFEADAHGRMRRVSAPSDTAAEIPPPLWKPEPDFLAQHAAELQLDAARCRSMDALDAAWRREKSQWEAEMRSALDGPGALLQEPSSAKRVSLAQVRQGMSEYSAISREYDARRADVWEQAADLLTEAQRRKLDALAHQRRRARKQ